MILTLIKTLKALKNYLLKIKEAKFWIIKNKIVFKNNEKTIKILYWKDYCEDSDTEISLTNYIEQNSLYFRKKY